MTEREEILRFDPSDHSLEEKIYRGKKLVYKLFRNRQYVRRPVDADFQSLDLYEPLSYGKKSFNAIIAPILLLNRCGGYMSYSNNRPMRKPPQRGRAMVGTEEPAVGPAPGAEGGGAVSREDALLGALAAGLVVVIPGNRGRDCLSEDGRHFGKAPAMAVDLKAALRYLRFNAAYIPGDTERIISRGASAGGGMSALLGCSGNCPDYEPYFEGLGAASARDDVFACVCLSPVLDLEHQNCAYEWQYGRLPLNGFDNAVRPPVDQTLSSRLAAQFEEYMRELALWDRRGKRLLPENYREYFLREFLVPAAEKWLAAQDRQTAELYLRDRPWIRLRDGKVDFDFEDYEIYLGRLKHLAPFDSFELGKSENTAFGREDEEAAHYTEFVHHELCGDDSVQLPEHILRQRELINPMTMLRQERGDCAHHWWIRLGAKESGFAAPLVLCFVSMLERKFEDVDFRLIWDGGHCSEDDFDDQIDWIMKITGYRA